MEEVTKRLTEALHKVAGNRGAPGPDGETTSQLQERWERVEPTLRAALLKGSYRPGEIRRVEIPKSGTGLRKLGIPNVIDRVVQEAVRQVLEPLYEPTFHPSSHGFRPGRSCHTAVTEGLEHLLAGLEWVVDLDLDKFFDRVHRQRLLARLAQRVECRSLIVLIGYMLKAGVVLPDGVVVVTDEGVPQGGPLSPLLSNIVLDELDSELQQRGHRFVRYADDVKVFVRSERAGQRVMASLVRFIERRLRLQVNASKSAVARSEDRHFLGFRLRTNPEDGSGEILLSERTKRRATERIRELTPRNWGSSLRSCIREINVYTRGWYGFFGISSAREEYAMQGFDARIRRRLRAITLNHWKRRRTIARKLSTLGVRRETAWRRVYQGRKSTWALSHDTIVHRGLGNAYFAERGLVSLVELHRTAKSDLAAPAQRELIWE
jgi:group II intron reverse transcriptase/maturase